MVVSEGEDEDDEGEGGKRVTRMKMMVRKRS